MTITIEKLLSTAPGRAAAEELAEAQRVKRRELQEKLDAHNKQDEQKRKPLRQELEVCSQDLERALASVRRHEQKERAASLALSTHAVRADRERDEIEQQLESSIGDLLAPFFERVAKEHARLTDKRAVVESERAAVVRSWSIEHGPSYVVETKDNYDAICNRLRALGDLSQEAQRLARTVADPLPELEKLFKALPADR